MKKIFLLFLIFSINSFSQGFNRSKDFYKKGNFIEITRSVKPVKKSLSHYAANTHWQEGGTCVTHAIAQAMTILYSMRNGTVNKSEININSFSPYFIYVNLRNDFEAGLYTDEALDYIMDNGAPLITSVECDEFYPFNLNNPLSSVYKLSSKKIKEAKRNALNFKIKKYARLSTIDGIKQSISQNHPVVYCIDYTPPSLDELIGCELHDCYWKPKKSEKNEDNLGGHAMLIVGYDDNKGAVQVLNSWGKDFGNNGYFWIKYDDVFTGYVTYENCYLDIGTGKCFSYEDGKLFTTYSITEKEIVDFENQFDVTIPRGNGFGSEAYSIQGIYH